MPTKSKLLIPLLVALILLISSLTNLIILPEIVKDMCDSVKYLEESQNKTRAIFIELNKPNPDPNIIVSQLKEEDLISNKKVESANRVLDKMRLLTYGNFYYLSLLIFQLDPLYPSPCDFEYLLICLGMTPTKDISQPNCRFYMREDNYKCIYQVLSPPTSLGGIVMSPILPTTPFRPVSIPTIIFHSLIIILMLYLLICILFHIPKQLEFIPKFIPYILVGIISCFSYWPYYPTSLSMIE